MCGVHIPVDFDDGVGSVHSLLPLADVADHFPNDVHNLEPELETENRDVPTGRDPLAFVGGVVSWSDRNSYAAVPAVRVFEAGGLRFGGPVRGGVQLLFGCEAGAGHSICR
ncbi:MAG: hypothetical protein Devi2KO_39840 [Devosia indica]